MSKIAQVTFRMELKYGGCQLRFAYDLMMFLEEGCLGKVPYRTMLKLSEYAFCHTVIRGILASAL